MSSLPLATAPLPPPPPFRKLIGPSFIILGLGLGSGEIILWPYLTSNHGLGVVWAIVVGVTMQFFLNMEIEHYALICGESIFVGFARWLKWLPIWFIVSTLASFAWPGIGLAGATLLSQVISPSLLRPISIAIFISIGLILSFGRVLYTTVETLEKFLFLLGTPLIFILTLYLAKNSDWPALARGLIGIGPGYIFLPTGISLATFLGALAFSGAGGNLNLAQSFYIRDKGYGMGHYSDRIQNLITSASSPLLRLTGTTFPPTPKNLTLFHRWWRLINLEHFFVFWFLGLLTMLTLTFLSFITTHGLPGTATGINFVVFEAAQIGLATAPFLGTLFLLTTGLMLVATQLTVLDSTSRIITENLLLLRGSASASVGRLYYTVLWLQILFGIAVFSFSLHQPRQLITLSAVISAASMFVYTLLILRHHHTRLHPTLRPSFPRTLALTLTALFLGALTLLNLFL